MLPTSLLPLLALVSLAVADPIHVPLRRRNVAQGFDLDRIAAAADNVRNRYGFRRPSSLLPSRRAGQTVGIQTINEVRAFVSMIAFGAGMAVRLWDVQGTQAGMRTGVIVHTGGGCCPRRRCAWRRRRVA